MDNQFYSSFDTTCFEEGRDPDYRSAFQRDRDRLIHTFAFRRLQDKTQVFMSGDYDFYRTRLTHSIEVAQIGRSICNHLKQSDPALGEDYHVSPALVEATCIAHDLGHPPFGHAGEDALNQLMKEYGGFEANAQTVRLLTETIYKDREEGGRKGMAPTRGLVDGILKYKTIYSDHPTGDKHFIYDRQEPVLDFAFGGEGFPDGYSSGKERNDFRSLECQIMDWADDAAYSTNDLVDGIRAGFISAKDIQEWGESQSDVGDYEEKQIEKLIEAIEDGYSEPYLSAEIGAFVKACSLEERDCFMSEKTNRYAYSLNIDSKAERKKELYSNLSFDLLFKSPRVVQLEHKGERMLRQLFSSLTENYIQEKEELTLLPRDVHRRVTETDQQQASDKRFSSEAHWKARLLCDYVAGMTDGFASRTYKRLFDPDFGSIADLV